MQMGNNHVGKCSTTRKYNHKNHEDVKSVAIIERKPLLTEDVKKH